MKKMAIHLLGLLFAATMPTLASAQITINSTDLLGIIGSKNTILQDKRFSIPVDVGSPGANQVWDFRNTTIVDSVFATFEYLRPQELPSSATYPDANLVQRITSITEPGFELYNFYNITPSHFIDLGDSSRVLAPFDTTFVKFQRDTIAALPIAFNQSWVQTENDTTGPFPLIATISIDTTLNTIDAWGTVRLPMGDFECLRLRQEVKVTNRQVVNGIVLSTTVDSYIQYDWIAKNFLMVANAQSQNGDTDPNFTNAQGFGRLDAFSAPTGVANKNDLPSQFQLSQNYPNPFNPQTVIRYQLMQTGPIEIAIFNLSGQKVRTLVNTVHGAGAYEVQWNGTDDFGKPVASGIYLYHLKSGQFISTRKMILLQ